MANLNKTSLLKVPSTLSGIVLVVATGVGGGMFSLPVVMAGAWFSWGVVVLVIIGLIMLLTALMLVEVNLHYDAGASFDTFTKDLLGKHWSILVGIAFGFVLYILTYAYMSGSSAVLSQSIAKYTASTLTASFCVILITIVVGLIVSCSSMLVGRITTILLFGKFIAFFMTFSGLVSHIEIAKLLDSAEYALPQTTYLPYIFIIFPFCILSFGFHGNVPSMVKHFNKDTKKITHSIIYGTIFAMLLYIFWLAVTMGNIPRAEFSPIISQGGNIDVFVSAMEEIIASRSMDLVLTFFGNFAVAASLLAATLGLFDYIADLCKFENTFSGRIKTAIVTYCPPAIVCFFFPNGFIIAIGYAGLAFTLWSVILPPFLVKKSRQRFANQAYRAPSGKILLNLIIISGGLVYLTVILDILGLLPVFK